MDKPWYTRTKEWFWPAKQGPAPPPEPSPLDHEWLLEQSARQLARHREALRNMLDKDEDDWVAGVSGRYSPLDVNSSNVEEKVAGWRLTCEFPSSKRALKLYRQLVFNPGFRLGLKRIKGEKKDTDAEVNRQVLKEWNDTVQANLNSWSLGETVIRALRDGDMFLSYKGRKDGYIKVYFIDSEEIRDRDRNGVGEDNKGIVTKPDDVTEVLRYTRYRDATSPVEDLKPEETIHIKCDVDSNVKRGRCRFDGLQRRLAQIEEFVDTEYEHRRLQACFVLHRKVTGGAKNTNLVLDNAYAGHAAAGDTHLPAEKVRPGMFITTNGAVEFEFKTPDGKYEDATGIGRQLTRVVCQVTGFTYEMLSADVSEGNLASAEIAEGPVQDMIATEREFFCDRLQPLFQKIVDVGVDAGRIVGYNPEEFQVIPVFAPGKPKDIQKVAQAANTGIMGNFLSKRQAARMMNQDPDQMFEEIREEFEDEALIPASNNPTLQARADSAAGNAGAGGTNQGAGGPISHSDNKSSGKK